MYKILGVLLACTLSAYGQGNSQVNNKISEADLKDYLSILSSNTLEGRATPSRGQQMAAAFIAHHFEEIGLTGPVNGSNGSSNGSYYQPIELYATTLGEAYVKAGGVTYPQFSGVVFTSVTKSTESGGEESVPLVFAGYGTLKDFQAVDVKDKAVLVIRNDSTGHSVSWAAKFGAKMIMNCDFKDGDSFEKLAVDVAASKDRLGWNITKYEEQGPARVRVSKEIVEKVMGTSQKKMLDAAAKNKLKSIRQRVISYKSATVLHTTKTQNVLGYLEGTDKKDEVVVVSAHYDHIGKQQSGEGDLTKDLINNGADDDGSGTACVMELAKQFAKAKKDGNGPRRSMLFIAFTGEEKGLWGSQYYTDHPVFPLKNTVVDLNIDMVGRRDSVYESPEMKKLDYIYVIGSDKLSAELHQLSEEVNRKNLNLLFDYSYNDPKHPERIYYRSDHWNFARNNVPIIFYFSGIHKDYHKVSDEIEKIDFDLMAKRAQMIFYTAWEIANREKRVELSTP